MLFRSLVVSGILLALGYISIDAVASNSDMILGMRVTVVAISSMVMVCWGSEFWNAIKSPTIRHGHLSACGVFLTAAWFAIESSYLVIFRLAGQPQWFANSDLTAGIIMYQGAAFAMLVMEPAVLTVRGPTRNRLAAGIATGLAAVVLLLLIGTRPNLGPVLERIKPYVTDWFGTG